VITGLAGAHVVALPFCRLAGRKSLMRLSRQNVFSAPVALLAVAMSCGSFEHTLPASGSSANGSPIGNAGGSTAATVDSGRPPCSASGPEICDGLDNDCNGEIDDDFALHCGPCTDGRAGCIEARVTGGGWRVGTARNLVVGNDRGIYLPSLPQPSKYIYIANAGDGTVSKIRIADAVEVARIIVGDNPSRTAVDGNGDAWVAMRGNTSDDGTGPRESVVKIAGDCIPNVKPPTPTHECVLLDIPEVGNLLRGVAVDARNNVWIGSFATQELIYLDGTSGAIKERIGLGDTSATPYGIALDPDGFVWAAMTSAQPHVVRVDPVRKAVDLRVDSPQPYGIAADADGGIWFGTNGTNVFRVDAVTGAVDTEYTVGTTTRGVCLDDAGFLWAADSTENVAIRVDRTTGDTVKVAVGSGPVGVAADSDGNIWVANELSNNVTKIAPNGNVLATVPVGNDPYTYSDMAGSAYRIFRKLRGVFTATYGTGVPGAVWTGLTWTGSAPAPATVGLRLRAADGELSKAAWQQVSLAGPSASFALTGAQIEVEVTLYTADRVAIPNVEQIALQFRTP
jgi:sugar lactone lactonase YvrE